MAVLISIKPKWCELIVSGKKTIEVRKSRPKCETPFKCYIYCTNDRKTMLERSNYDKSIYLNGNIYYPYKMDCSLNGKAIGEFTCDFINKFTAEFVDDDCYEEIRQIWENEEDEDFPYTAKITSNEDENPDNCFLCNDSCLTFKEIKKYIGVNFHDIPFYGWNISDLKIYDKPKDLNEFHKPCTPKCNYSEECGGTNATHCLFSVERAPQSWMYVEELK